MTSKEPLAVEVTMLAEARAEVAQADTKASMLLAALGVGFGVVLAGLIAGDWSPSKLEGAGEALWWIGAVLAVASVTVAACAVWPRFTRGDAREGIRYWGHVATYKSFESFAAAIESVPAESRDRTLHQLWRLSRLVARKYDFVRGAMILVAAAVLFFLLASATGG